MYKIVSLLFFVFAFSSSRLYAFELRLGQSWFEQGDYLLHPGVNASLVRDDKKSLRVEFYGRRFGSFTEATTLLSFNLPYQVLPFKDVTTSFGVSLLDEYTAYKPKMGKDESLHAFNAGVNLGIAYRYLSLGSYHFAAEWNSHIFAAGLAALVMTTARKSVFSLTAGYEL